MRTRQYLCFNNGNRTKIRLVYTLLKIFKGTHDNFSIGDNVDSWSIDKLYISLNNKAETPSFISLQRESKYWAKKGFLTKQSLLKFMAQIL